MRRPASSSAGAPQPLSSITSVFRTKVVDTFVDLVNRLPLGAVVDGANVLCAGGPPLLSAIVSKVIVQHGVTLVILPYGQPVALNDVDAFVEYYSPPSRHDDLYWLYAALQSAPETIVITNDKCRDHIRRHPTLKSWCARTLVPFRHVPGLPRLVTLQFPVKPTV